MAHRLGVVLNVAGMLAAAIALVLASFIYAKDGKELFVLAAGGVAALCCYGVGRACRYVLSGY